MKEWGIMVPQVVPCHSNGALDEEGLRRVSQDLLSAGCHSLFVGSSTGRGPWMTRAERARICRMVVDLAGPAVPVVAGCIALSLEEMLENAAHMADAGAQAAVVTAPGYFKYSQTEIERIFLAFANASPLPVMLYDIPDFTGVKLDPQMILRLARHERIIGFKDSTDDFERFQNLLVLLKERPDFYMLQGKERWLADSLRLGASGFVVSMIHLEPALFVGLYKAVRSGDWVTARQLQNEVAKVMDLVKGAFSLRPETSTLFHFLNQVLRLRGVCENIVLEQDGNCPDWLLDLAGQAHRICQQALGSLREPTGLTLPR
jgi:4-hydroxy-tetrahydrodipicolinate synthase